MHEFVKKYMCLRILSTCCLLWLATSLSPADLAVAAPRSPGEPFFYRSWGADEGLAGDVVNAVSVSPDAGLWTAGSGGLTYVDLASGRATAFRRGQELPAIDVTSLAVAADGILWGTTSTQHLFRFDGEQHQQWPLPKGSRAALLGWFATSDPGTNVQAAWVATGSGKLHAFVVKAEGKQQRPELWRSFEVSQAGCGGDPAALAPRRQGGHWVALWNGGLGYIDQGVFRCAYPIAHNEKLRWSADLVEDPSGRLWVANGQNTGLLRIDLDGRMQALTEKDGLPCDNIVAIERRQDALWFLCGAGMIVAQIEDLNKALQRQTPHAVVARAPFREHRSFAVGRAPFALVDHGDMQAWVGTDRGLVGVAQNRDFVGADHEAIVTGLKVNGQTVAVGATVNLTTPSATVSVSVGLARQPSAFVPAFRLAFWQGPSAPSTWVSTREGRWTQFDDIRPGLYTLAVLPNDESGRWRPDLAQRFAVTLRPRWVDRWWVRLLAMLGGVGLVAAVPVLRGRQRARQAQVLQQERKRISQDLHDGIGQTLASIGFHVEAIEELLPQDAGQISPVLERLKRLVQAAQQSARQAIWDLRAVNEATKPLKARLTELVERVRKENPNVSLKFNPEARPLPWRAFVEHELYLIAQEAVRNALVHASAKSISVTLLPEGLEVCDDGKGFLIDDRRHTEGGRFGIVSMRERANRISAQFDLTSEPDKGTTVRVIVPAGNSV